MVRLRKYGMADVDGNDFVMVLEEKPAGSKTNWCCLTFYFYTQKDIKLVAEGSVSGRGTNAPGSYMHGCARRHA